MCAQRNGCVRSQREAVVYKARGVASGDTSLGILIMDFWLPGRWEATSVGGILLWQPEQANTGSEGLTSSVGWSRPAWDYFPGRYGIRMAVFSLSSAVWDPIWIWGTISFLEGPEPRWYKRLVGREPWLVYVQVTHPDHSWPGQVSGQMQRAMCLGGLGLPSCRCCTRCLLFYMLPWSLRSRLSTWTHKKHSCGISTDV